MTTISDLNRILRDFEDSPEGVGYELRLNLSEIVLRNLRSKGWTQRRLADESKKLESYITRVVHSQQNCGLDTVGKILHALGVRASLVESSRQMSISTPSLRITYSLDGTHGEEETVYEEETDAEEIVQVAVGETGYPRHSA